MSKMDRFLHYANLERFRKQLANTPDEVKRRTLLELLDAEEARGKPIRRSALIETIGGEAVVNAYGDL